MQEDILSSLPGEARRMQLFSGLPDAETDEILGRAHPREAIAGEILFRQREDPDRLLLVLRGLVRMSQSAAVEEQTTLRLMGAGELIGCVAVIRRFPYPATATAVEDCVLLHWNAEEFLELMKRNPAMTRNLLDIVGDKTREMVERVGEISGKGLEARLATALLRLARQAGLTVNGRVQIKMSAARSDLATLAGVGYFTISRVLSLWQKQGIVESGRQRIAILDEDRLARIGGEHLRNVVPR